MYRTTERTQKRKDKKRQLILDAAARVFSAKGYHNATVNEIVKEAAVSVGGFYSYFAGKKDLFLGLYRSIVKRFDDITVGVLDVENYSLLKNFTRVMTAMLWMYQQQREIARIILLESAAVDPDFQKIEADRMSESSRVMADWFKRFRSHSGVSIPDERVAALMYSGTYYCLINDWLLSGAGTSLTEYSFAFCVYNLQALKIPFDGDVIKTYIEEVLRELSERNSNETAEHIKKGEIDG